MHRWSVRPRRSRAMVPTALLIAGILAGCGSGTVAIVAGSDDSGGGGTTPALDLFVVENP